MDARSMLLEAQMHLECINEAFCELEIGKTDEARRRVIWNEVCSRVWAGIYLVQAARDTSKKRPENFAEVVREANSFNELMPDEIAPIDGMH